MPPETDQPIRWWLPFLGIAAFAAILGIWIAVNTWDFTGHSSPDRYSPWKESAQSSGDGSMDLAANFIPQWTPDGQTILLSITRGFRYTQPPPSASVPQELIYEGSIYSVEALTGETNRLSTVRGPVEIDASPQISPDGSQYAHVTSQYYEEGNRNFEMAISDVDGPEITRITQDLHYIRRTDTHPKWSPDGSTLAFVKRDAYRDDLTPGSVETINTVYTVPAQGGEPVPLFPTADQLTSLETRRGYPNVVDAPVWSPNSRQIAIKVHGSLPLEKDAEDYIRYESLIVVDRNSGETKEVLRTDRWKTSIAGPLTWSPNGRELTFIRGYPTNYLSPSGPPEPRIRNTRGNGNQTRYLRRRHSRIGHHKRGVVPAGQPTPHIAGLRNTSPGDERHCSHRTTRHNCSPILSKSRHLRIMVAGRKRNRRPHRL